MRTQLMTATNGFRTLQELGKRTEVEVRSTKCGQEWGKVVEPLR